VRKERLEEKKMKVVYRKLEIQGNKFVWSEKEEQIVKKVFLKTARGR